MAISGLHFFNKLKVLFMKKFLFFLPLILLSCVGSPKVDYSQMPYKDIPREEFKKLPFDIQYSIKYKGVPENLLLVECVKKDTVYAEDGSMLKTEYVPDTFNILMLNDSMLFFIKHKCKEPELFIEACEELYVPSTKKFTKNIYLALKYDKRRECYYLLKSDFPKIVRNDLGNAVNSVRLRWEPKKTPFDYDLKSRNRDYVYFFSESFMCYRGYYGTFGGKPLPERDEFECEQNQISSFLRWATGDQTYTNRWTDK